MKTTFTSKILIALAVASVTCVVAMSPHTVSAWPSSDPANSSQGMSGPGNNYSSMTGDSRGGGGGGMDDGPSTDDCVATSNQFSGISTKNDIWGSASDCPDTETPDPSDVYCPIKVNTPIITRPATGEFKYKLYWDNQARLEILNPDGTRRIYDTRLTPETDYIRPTDQLGTYTANLQLSGIGTMCSVTYQVIAPQCSDSIDNIDSEDTLADAADPGCHTDGNPNNPATYDPLDDDETNTPNTSVKPNLTAAIGQPLPAMTAGASANVKINVSNTTDIAIDTPSVRAITFQKYPLANNPVTVGWSNANTYAANQVRDNIKTVTAPNSDGQYQVCAVADVNNVIDESNEADNSSCADVRVGAGDKPNLSANLRALPTLRAGEDAKIPVTITNTSAINISTESDRKVTFQLMTGGPVRTFYIGTGTYAPNFQWNRALKGTVPSTPGNYRVCVVADSTDVIDESNETDNSDCRENVRVRDPKDDDVKLECADRKDNDGDGDFDYPDDAECSGPNDNDEGDPGEPVTGGETGDPTLTADPTLVRRGGVSTLSWTTGGHSGCVIRGNGQTISNPQNSPAGDAPTAQIVAETTYTMTCAGGASADATIKVLPSLQEI